MGTEYVIDTGYQLVNDLEPGYQIFRTPLPEGRSRIEIRPKGTMNAEIRDLCAKSLMLYLQTGDEPPGIVPQVFAEGLLERIPQVLPDLPDLPDLPSPGTLLKLY